MLLWTLPALAATRFLSTDGRAILEEDAGKLWIRTETERRDAGAVSGVAWADIDPDGTVWVVQKDGWIGRPGAPLTKVGAPLWVEPSWKRRSLLVAIPDQGGLRVLEVALKSGAQKERYQSLRADDVVFDAHLRPRFAWERQPRRLARGLDVDTVFLFDGHERALGETGAMQPSWIADRGAWPRIGAAPPVMLGLEGDATGIDLHRIGDTTVLGVLRSFGWKAWSQPGPADATHVLVAADGTVDAIGAYAERLLWTPLTPAGQALVALGEKLGTDVHVLDRSADDRRWLVASWSGSQPRRELWLDRDTDRIIPLDPDVPAGHPVEATTIAARDGQKLAAYLLRPEGGKAPLVVRVHDGPWNDRFTWTFDPEAERLAAQGYAVLSVNHRGTYGWGWNAVFGSGFVGDAMIHDVEDAIGWAIDQGVADPERVAVMGPGFGGYVALRLATEPSKVSCAIAGLSDGNLTARNDKMDLESVAGEDWRIEHSPDQHTAALHAPVLLWTGGRDGNRPDAIKVFFDRARENGKAVTWLKFPREGHGLKQAYDRDALALVEDRFLAQCFGRTPRPFGPEIPGAEVEVHGAWSMVGLEAAFDAARGLVRVPVAAYEIGGRRVEEGARADLLLRDPSGKTSVLVRDAVVRNLGAASAGLLVGPADAAAIRSAKGTFSLAEIRPDGVALTLPAAVKDADVGGAVTVRGSGAAFEAKLLDKAEDGTVRLLVPRDRAAEAAALLH